MALTLALGFTACGTDSSAVAAGATSTITVADDAFTTTSGSVASSTDPVTGGPVNGAASPSTGATTVAPSGPGPGAVGTGSVTTTARRTVGVGPATSPGAIPTTTFLIPDNAVGASNGGTPNGVTNPNNGGAPDGGLPNGGAPLLPPNPGDSKNCSDFATYADAKQWFDYYRPAYGDVAKLDPDRDLMPCTELPGAPIR